MFYQSFTEAQNLVRVHTLSGHLSEMTYSATVKVVTKNDHCVIVPRALTLSSP